MVTLICLCWSLLPYWGLVQGKEPAKEMTAGREGRDAGAAPGAVPAVNRNAERPGTVVPGELPRRGRPMQTAPRQSQHASPRGRGRGAKYALIKQTSHGAARPPARPGATEPGSCGFTTPEEGVTSSLEGCEFWEGVSFLGVMPPPSPRTGLRAQKEPTHLPIAPV